MIVVQRAHKGQQPEQTMSIDSIKLSREDLRRRWKISVATLKRMEKRGDLRPERPSPRIVRYDLEDILEIEAASKN